MLGKQDMSRRAEVLRRVTDLFIQGSGRFTDDQIELFDEVMNKLVRTIELAARAAFGSRLAGVRRPQGHPHAGVRRRDRGRGARAGAFARLDDAALVENARTKSQRHLLAISGRSILCEAVTDVLVERGDNQVVRVRRQPRRQVLAAGSSASSNGRRTMRSGDVRLVAPRHPRHDLLKLFVQASEMLRSRLEAADPRRAAVIRARRRRSLRRGSGDDARGSHEHAQASAMSARCIR